MLTYACGDGEAVGQSIGVLWIKTEGFVKLAHRFGITAASSKSRTHIGVGVGVARIQIDGLLQIRYGTPGFAGLQKKCSKVVVSINPAREISRRRTTILR